MIACMKSQHNCLCLSNHHNKKKKYLSVFRLIILAVILMQHINATAQDTSLQNLFKHPPLKYRPAPLWFINGKLTKQEIDKQVTDAYKAGFGGVAPLPLTAGFSFGGAKPGMEPAYFSDEYFIQYENILKKEKELGLHHILYDEVNFPSGIAGGEMRQKYPNDIRKILFKKDTLLAGTVALSMPVPKGVMMAVVAMDTISKKRIDLISFVKNNQLNWKVPGGNWKVMIFTADVMPSAGEAGYMDVVDYLDPQAVDKFISISYDVYARHFKNYFGNTIQQIFYDDVGFFTFTPEGQRTWTYRFNEKFKELYKTDPAIYYPALWEDIGPETQAARVAFFNTRAELFAEGWPRKINEWTRKNNLKASGHPPDNYNPQPVHMNGDIFKFYRHQEIPTMDLIFSYGRGRDGYKLISSAANLYDRPVVAAEIYGAIGMMGSAPLDKKMLYKAAMDVFIRGVNFLIPHGMWYNPDTGAIRIPPLVSSYSDVIGSALPAYNAWAGRSSMLLQGGTTVADIAVLYPIASLQAWYEFGHFTGFTSPGWSVTPPENDYLQTGDILTTKTHRDFTFIHPESLHNGAIKFVGIKMILDNAVNKQTYHTLIMPGGKVMSVKALEKIKSFYDNGGNVIATTMLPSRSAEFHEDEKIVALIKQLFETDPAQPMPQKNSIIKTNAKGGKIIFIPVPDSSAITEAFIKMGILPDVAFENNPMPTSGNGSLSYIHKKKDGKEIYFFANTSDDNVETYAELRGRIKPETWDPYDGSTSTISDVKYIQINGEEYTRIPLRVNAVQSVFVIGSK